MAQLASLALAVGLMYAGIFHISGIPVFPNIRENTVVSKYLAPMELENIVYNSSLLDPSSDYYKDVESKVMDAMNQVYACPDCPTKSFYEAENPTFQSGPSGTALPSTWAYVYMNFYTEEIDIDVVLYLYVNAPPVTSLGITLFQVCYPYSSSPYYDYSDCHNPQ